MGWDAYAITKKNKDLAVDYHGNDISDVYKTPTLIYPPFEEGFKAARKKTIKKAKMADAYLGHGGLDCSECAYMLNKAIKGSHAWEDKWTATHVKKLAKSADWNFTYDEDDTWAYYSAKHFLETCAKLNLGIRFSF